MKINVEFDLTPAEFRESLGLPDVEAFQRDMMNRIQQQMAAGVEGYDPWSLMQSFLQTGLSQNLNQGLNQGLSQGMASLGNYQQMMLDMFRQAGGNATASPSSGAQEKQETSEKKANTSKSGNTSSTRSSAANSSRSKSRKTQN